MTTERAIARLTDTAEALERDGMEPLEVAGTLLAMGLSIGTRIHGPARVASILRLMALRYDDEAGARTGNREPACCKHHSRGLN